MSIKGYNYVVSLIAYLKQNLQGFNARFERGGGKGNWDINGYNFKNESLLGRRKFGAQDGVCRGGGGIGPHRFLSKRTLLAHSFSSSLILENLT